MILKARAENGASSLAGRSSGDWESGLMPLTGGISNGEGKYATTASSKG
jgi:hypothetical protein